MSSYHPRSLKILLIVSFLLNSTWVPNLWKLSKSAVFFFGQVQPKTPHGNYRFLANFPFKCFASLISLPIWGRPGIFFADWRRVWDTDLMVHNLLKKLIIKQEPYPIFFHWLPASHFGEGIQITGQKSMQRSGIRTDWRLSFFLLLDILLVHGMWWVTETTCIIVFSNSCCG